MFDVLIMGVVVIMVLVVNVGVVWMLYVFCEGDVNMCSVWLCLCNDVIGNVVVFLVVLGVFGIGKVWLDLSVVSLMVVFVFYVGW